MHVSHGAPRRHCLSVDVAAAGYDRYDKPVEVEVELGPAPFDGRSLTVAEVDDNGDVLDGAVPCQFDSHADGGEVGTLVFLLKGRTRATQTRRFRVYWGTAGERVGAAPPSPLVSVMDGVVDEGQECFQIVTPGATYYYQKQGGGFSSLLDPEGRDWINHHPGGGSAGEYRGIPNLGECGHPGYTNATSRLASGGPLRARIVSRTLDGRWEWAWDIFPRYARMTLERAGGKYWFLYEGTPGGELDEDNDYCVRSPGVRTPASEVWSGDLPDPEWVYFGSGKTRRVLYLVHHEDNDQPDQYWPMEGNMTVFGFGRTYGTIERFMERLPAHFTVGFADDGALESARRVIDSAFRDLAVTFGQPEAVAQ